MCVCVDVVEMPQCLDEISGSSPGSSCVQRRMKFLHFKETVSFVAKKKVKSSNKAIKSQGSEDIGRQKTELHSNHSTSLNRNQNK